MKDGRALAAAAIPAAFLAVVYAFAWATPSVGLYHDDGVYTVTAKAIAEGRGYRIISLPQEIPQTKYPFLFPASLALVWRAAPNFPGNVPALKSVPLLCAIGWFGISYLLLVRLGAPRLIAVVCVLLTAASPLIVYLSTNMMSETMFGMCFAASLLAARNAETSDSIWAARLAGLFSACSYLTRSIGVAALLGIPLALLLQCRFRGAVRFCAVGYPLAAVWPIWVWLHRAPDDASLLYYSSANYASWNVLTNYEWGEKTWIALSNVIYTLVAPFTLFDLPSSLWMAIAALLLILAAIFRGGLPLNSTCLAVGLYIALVLCWAWPSPRFVTVILPIILYLMAQVFARVVPWRRTPLALGLIASAILCSVIARDLSRIPTTRAEGQFAVGRRSADDWSEMTKLFSWIRANGAENAVLLTNLDPAFYLYTGRKAIRDFVPDSRKLFYSFKGPTADALGSFDGVLRATHADYLILTPDVGFAEAPVLRGNVNSFIARCPSCLELIPRAGADPEYRVYAIRSRTTLR